MRALRLGLAIAVAVLCSARASVAADDVQSFDVKFSAPDDCPSYYSFIEQVLARTSRARASTRSPDYRFTLMITPATNGLRGELAIVGARGVENKRHVPGEDCISVVEAAALIAALVLDPHAATGPLHASVGAMPAVPGAQPRRQTPVDANAPRASPPEADLAPERVPESSREPEQRFHVGAVGAATLNGAVAPGVTPGVALGVRLRENGGPVVAPLFGLDAEFASTSSIRGDLGTASFTWLAARLSACPVRWRSESVAVRPCAIFDAGVVLASGEDTLRGREHTVPWFAPGALGRFEWRATRIAGFALEAGAIFPLFRDRYVFLPDDVVHEVPAVGLTASLGAILWLDGTDG